MIRALIIDCTVCGGIQHIGRACHYCGSIRIYDDFLDRTDVRDRLTGVLVARAAGHKTFSPKRFERLLSVR